MHTYYIITIFKSCYTRLLGGTDFLCIYISKFDKIKFSILPSSSRQQRMRVLYIYTGRDEF